MGKTPVLLLKVVASVAGSYFAGRLILGGYDPPGVYPLLVFISYASVFLAAVILLWQKSRWSMPLLLRALAFVGATIVIYNIAVVAGVEAYNRKVVSSDGAFATGMAVLGLLLPAAHVSLLAAPLRRAAVAMLAAYAVWFAGFRLLSRFAPSVLDLLSYPVGQTLFFGFWLLPYLVGVYARWPARASPKES